ncbi:MAG: hypothetical protein BWK76_04630 [Desulfobulbaceae bacterium A2]|nr:MAG: hypothetical protein BWK76_04630 [Desulfobulbaceae bacterium A2]
MIYGNLFFFLAAIFCYSLAGAAQEPRLPPVLGAVLLLVLVPAYCLAARMVHRRLRPLTPAAYMSAERRLSLLALAAFVVAVFILDLKFHLHRLLGPAAPLLLHPAGLACFFLLLCGMWVEARRNYELVFHRRVGSRAFLLSNLRSNLPLVLPWLVLTLLADVFELLAPEEWRQALAGPWADLFFFALFILFLALFFPPLVRRLWGCRDLPAGPLRDFIEEFCHRLGFHARILTWPLFEGQVITAGVMGLVPPLRYLLLTPALLETMNPAELQAVLAHEIGHVVRRHLWLYLLLFFGFSALMGVLAEPIPLFLLRSDSVFQVLSRLDLAPETMITLLSGLPLLVLMLLFFRFVLGWFIRNFERQADQFVFAALGSAAPLISAFERIAQLSGNIREQPSWHHFGLGERIRWLEACESNPALIRRHDRGLRRALIGYVVLVTLLFGGMKLLDQTGLSAGAEERFLELTLQRKLRLEPNNPLWFRLAGDLLQAQRMERRAMESYERALELEPLNAETLNNLAWLLLTARNETLRDPRRALTLARSAVALHPGGHILDTLATAYWANGLVEEALQTEAHALHVDPGHGTYYRSQMEKFRSQHPEGKDQQPEVRQPQPEEGRTGP